MLQNSSGTTAQHPHSDAAPSPPSDHPQCSQDTSLPFDAESWLLVSTRDCGKARGPLPPSPALTERALNKRSQDE